MKWPFQRVKQELETKQEITLEELGRRWHLLNQVFSGQSVTPANAMKCTTVHGIVRALTNAIGIYPPSIGVVQQAESGPYIQSLPDHALNKLLRHPNRVHTSTQFWRMVIQHAALYGNHWSIKGQTSTGPIGFLRPIQDPERVTLDSVNTRASQIFGIGVVWRVQFDDGEQFVPQNRMFHVTSGLMSDDGVTGKSPVELAKQAIGICLAAEQFIAELYGNNAVPSLVLTGGKWTSPEQYDDWILKWKSLFGAGGERGGTAMTPEGMTVQEVGFKPIDAQALEMRQFQRIEIAQVYGVPPHKLADLERATFSNIEEQSLEFVRDVAAPWVRLVEQAATRDLVSQPDQNANVVVRFDMERATEGKLSERMDAYGKAHEIGAMNPNEIRQRIGMDPREDDGGNEYVTPLNMRTSSDELPDETETTGDDDPDQADDSARGSVRAVR